jgi:hypothetical protein
MRPDPENLRAARDALVAFDAPVCGCPLGAEVDDFGGVHCPQCQCVYGSMRDACQACGWQGDFYCDRPVGHDGNHGSGFGDVDPEHLRAALAEVDRLQNVLLVERGEGVPPSPEWASFEEYSQEHCSHRVHRGWYIRRESAAVPAVIEGDDGWMAAMVAVRYLGLVGEDVHVVRVETSPPYATAFEAMEAANTALGVR